MSLYIKSFLKIILTGIVGILIFCSILLIPHVHNSIAKFIIMRYLQNDVVEVTNCDITLSAKKIKIRNADITILQNKFSIPELTVEYNISQLVKKLGTEFQILAPKLLLNSNIQLSASISGVYKQKDGKLTLIPHIESKEFEVKDCNIKKLSFDSIIEIGNGKTSINNTKLLINEGSISGKIEISSKNNVLEDLTIVSSVHSINLNLYKEFLPKTHPVYEFFESNILGGKIDSGEIRVSIPYEFIKLIGKKTEKEIYDQFLDRYVDAKIILSDVIYKYSDYMPKIKSNNLNLNINGKNIVIDLPGTKIAGNVVTKGTVSFDYLAENLDIVVDANTKGTVCDLIQFISPDTIAKMLDSNIDLSNLKGIADTKISIIIPVGQKISNKYDIKSNISNVEGKFLNNRITLRKYILGASFDGDQVIISGNGTTNGFKSNLNLLVNLDESAEISHKLLGKIYITGTPDETNGIRFIDGTSELNYEFIAKKNITSFKANANLINLHFAIPSISLDKPNKKKAFFSLTGEIKEGKKQKLVAMLNGEDGLKITSVIDIDDVISKIILSEVKYLNNDFNAEVISGNNSLVAKISGGLIDLSEAELSKMFQNENSEIEDVNLDIHLDTVLMKNNINLKNVNINAKCKNKNCPTTSLKANIGDNKVTIEYKNILPKPCWYIETDNAGKLLSSLGLTTKIKNGSLVANIEAPVSEKNNENYISNGSFKLRNFSSTQNKFLSRIISFISIQGLLSAIGGKDIYFDSLDGAFKIQNKQIKIASMNAKGPYFDFLIYGTIDTNIRKIDFGGKVVPSFYGLNKLMGSIPLIKGLFGKRGVIGVIPFSIHDSY